MINYTWQIIKVFSKNELITGVKYKLIGDDQATIIESEGTYYFKDPILTLPFLDVTEAILINWLDTETRVVRLEVTQANHAEDIKELRETTINNTNTRSDDAGQLFSWSFIGYQRGATNFTSVTAV